MSDTEEPRIETWERASPRGTVPRTGVPWLAVAGLAWALFAEAYTVVAALKDHFVWPFLWSTPFYLFSGLIAIWRLRRGGSPWRRPKLELISSLLGPMAAGVAVLAIANYLNTRLNLGVTLSGINQRASHPSAVCAAAVAPMAALSVVMDWIVARIGVRAAERTTIAMAAIIASIGACFAPIPVELRAVIFACALVALAFQTLAPDLEFDGPTPFTVDLLRRRLPGLAKWLYAANPRNFAIFGTPEGAVVIRVPRPGIEGQAGVRAFRDVSQVRAGEWAVLNGGKRVFVAAIVDLHDQWAVVSDRELSYEECEVRRQRGDWDASRVRRW